MSESVRCKFLCVGEAVAAHEFLVAKERLITELLAELLQSVKNLFFICDFSRCSVSRARARKCGVILTALLVAAGDSVAI